MKLLLRSQAQMSLLRGAEGGGALRDFSTATSCMEVSSLGSALQHRMWQEHVALRFRSLGGHQQGRVATVKHVEPTRRATTSCRGFLAACWMSFSMIEETREKMPQKVNILHWPKIYLQE